MSEQDKNPKPAQEDKNKGSKGAKIEKKDEKLSEEDLRKIGGGIEPHTYKHT